LRQIESNVKAGILPTLGSKERHKGRRKLTIVERSVTRLIVTGTLTEGDPAKDDGLMEPTYIMQKAPDLPHRARCVNRQV
jgi:hypothetical protein